MRARSTSALVLAAITIVGAITSFRAAPAASAPGAQPSDPTGRTPSTAAASASSPFVTIDPLTWADDTHQYTFTRRSDGPVDGLTVTRTPDDGWGDPDGAPGMRSIAFTPPAPEVQLDPVVAATGTGILTATWSPASCTAVCDRWFTQHDATGATVGTPVLVTAVPAPVRALPDGSLLTRSPVGALGWRGPDGTDRGAPDVAVDSVSGAGVDTAGRLLLALRSSTTLRWPTGGPVDLTQANACSSDGSSAIGGAPDGGFATACLAGSPAQLRVTRRTAAATVAWESLGTAGWPTSCCRGAVNFDQPTHVVVDDLDRVWVAGQASSSADLSVGPGALVESFSAAGPGPIADSFPFDVHGPTRAYTDLRLAPGNRVAFAGIESCCDSLEGVGDRSSTPFHGLVPLPPAVPSCSTELGLTAADEATVSGTLLPCDHPAIGREPTGYRVEARRADGTLAGTAEVGAGTGAEPWPFTIPAAVGGRLVRLTAIPFNALGDGAPSSSASTVAPFLDIEAFVRQQYFDLAGLGHPGTAVDLEVASGALAPSTVVTSLLATGYAADDVEPIARLYRAFFLRDADPSGLGYWVRVHRSGRSLSRVATQFATSSEFVRRYGKLGDGAFVAKLYENVFGRPADPSGAAFWTKRLQTKRATRGQVVLGFSESSESLRRTAATVGPLAAKYLLVGKLPTSSERTAWAAAPDPRTAAVTATLASAAYADRIAASP